MTYVKPISPEELKYLYFEETLNNLISRANHVCSLIYGNKVFLRGLIEFSNICSNNCLYCGIRKDNKNIIRYHLSEDQIIFIVKEGIKLGLKTFVLQSGENRTFNLSFLCNVIEKIKKIDNTVAITLSCGYFTKNELKILKKAGADRYLIRFEISDEKIYQKLKNGEKLSKRIKMLYNLKDLGYETGSGFMVGLPGENDQIMINNLLLCKKLELDMIGIGPFIPHPDTPLRNEIIQPINKTIKAVSLLRLILPYSNIPATTAAGSVDPLGREKMLNAGANVLMPNITPEYFKKNYLLYPNKICINETGKNCINCMGIRVKSVNKVISFEKGDSLNKNLLN